MQTKLLCALLLAACAPESDNPLPSATNTPHLSSLVTTAPCGEDLAFYGATAPDLRYAFDYDNGGRIQSATGTWLESGVVETNDYDWAGDNLTHILSTSGWDGTTAEVTASYDATNNLVDYTYVYTSPDYAESWTYAFSSFIAPGRPARETISSGGESYGYDLLYDAHDRLVAAVPDDGAATTWTYDDVARTITMDYDNGAYVGVTTYDAQNRQLGEAYTGSHPDVIDSDETWVWNGDNLHTVTSRSGTEEAPHTLEVVSTATMRYACSSARRAGNPLSRIARVHPMR